MWFFKFFFGQYTHTHTHLHIKRRYGFPKEYTKQFFLEVVLVIGKNIHSFRTQQVSHETS